MGPGLLKGAGGWRSAAGEREIQPAAVGGEHEAAEMVRLGCDRIGGWVAGDDQLGPACAVGGVNPQPGFGIRPEGRIAVIEYQRERLSKGGDGRASLAGA